MAQPQTVERWDLSSPLHNRLAPEDRPIHAWYRFVLSFPPHLVRSYIDQFGMRPGATVLDPFCGTATTIVEAMKQGLDGVGLDGNPMATLAGQVKTDWAVDPQLLRNEADRIAREATFELEGQGVLREARAVLRDQATLFGLLDLDPERRSLILAGSISPLPLHRSLLLLQFFQTASPRVIAYLRVALAWVLVNGAGNLRFGPEVGITPPKEDFDVVGAWHAQVLRMADDLDLQRQKPHGAGRVHACDSRLGPAPLEDRSVDFVFTSPPYPNEKDYTRTTRLESVILGLIRSKEDLRGLKQGLVRSNTRTVYVQDRDDEWVSNIASVQELAARIEATRIALGKDSGFERLYHRVTKLYFGGMASHLAELRRVLKPGAMLGYVVGDQASFFRVHIPTGTLLAEIATRLGYEHVRTDLFRTRLATVTGDQLREEVVVLRWPS